MQMQKWYSVLATSPKAVVCTSSITHYEYEIPYFNILSLKHRSISTRFRLGNHRLPIEIGRWLKVHREERFRHIGNHV